MVFLYTIQSICVKRNLRWKENLAQRRKGAKKTSRKEIDKLSISNAFFAPLRFCAKLSCFLFPCNFVGDDETGVCDGGDAVAGKSRIAGEEKIW